MPQNAPQQQQDTITCGAAMKSFYKMSPLKKSVVTFFAGSMCIAAKLTGVGVALVAIGGGLATYSCTAKRKDKTQ